MAITRGITDGGAAQTASSSYEELYNPNDTAADTSGGGRPACIVVTNAGSANPAVVKSWNWLTKSGAYREVVLGAGESVEVRGPDVTNGTRQIPGIIYVKSALGTTISWYTL